MDKSRERYAEERRIIRKAMLDEKLVVFVGAGTSLSSGMPSWKEAIKVIAERLNISDEELDNMKIPQYYYNSRGKKEYVELMREIFRHNDELEIHDVHRNIIKLNTHTIITTNYDCLLEKAAEENTEFIQTIRQDKDLPYKTAGKELIKMHGDFYHDNFVLREDDYLYYKKNFKLIESYIKSLIATNVVLFIGYSFNDPDVKHIFSWVKEILKDDFQRAYMLEMYTSFDVHEHEYYKNLGVNVIYASEIYEDFESHKTSEYINEFLEYILEEDSSENKIEKLYKQCESYAELRYIRKQYIRDMFYPYGITVENNELSAFAPDDEDVNDLLAVLFDNEKTYIDHKSELIKSVVMRSSINGVRIYKRKDKAFKSSYMPFAKISFTCLEEAIEEFDYRKLRHIREENEIRLSDTTPELYIEQAYISYILFDYVKAYRYLRKSAQLLYKNNQYVLYFIVEFNRKNIGEIIQNDYYTECTKLERKKINEEIKAIDIEELYRKIPSDKVVSKKFLQELYTCRIYYMMFQDTYFAGRKIEREAHTNYLLYTGMPEYKKLREQMKDCYLYDAYNYIMFDRYKEGIEIYRLFSRVMIKSACSIHLPTLNLSGPMEFNTGNKYAEHLEKFDIYIIIRYMSSKELEEVLKESCNGHVKINDEARVYLQKIVTNVEFVENDRYQWFWTYLVLAGYLELDDKLTTLSLEVIQNLINHSNILDYCDQIVRFLQSAENQKKVSFEKHSVILGNIIDKAALGIKSDLKLQYQKLLLVCLSIYKSIKSPYHSPVLYSLTCLDYYDVLARIYPLCDEEIQEAIKTRFHQWKWTGYGDISLYERAVLNGIIESDENIEEDILQGLDKLKNDSKGISPNPYDQTISALVNLYLNDEIYRKEEIRATVEYSEIDIFKWIIDVDNYDYENFEVEWLNNCQDMLLTTIAASPTAKAEITKSIKMAYNEGKVGKELLKKFIKHFI